MLAGRSPVSNLYDRPHGLPAIHDAGAADAWLRVAQTPAASADRPCTRTLSLTQQLGVLFAGDRCDELAPGPRSAEHVAAPEKLAAALLATGNYGEAGTFGAAPSAQ
jgi:hypothetical protein